MDAVELLKAASLGPLGDQVRGMPLEELHIRVVDQAERHGVHAPSWPRFVDLVREAPYLRLNEDDEDVDFVHPDPKRDAAEDTYKALKDLLAWTNELEYTLAPDSILRARVEEAIAKAEGRKA